MSKVRQKLVWLGEWAPARSGLGGINQAAPVRVQREPTRIWTLFTHTVEHPPPRLPFVPVMRHNAWLEDIVHDWNWQRGVLRYYSRVANGPVWLLLEYDA